ncbi:MAG: hypothetical protein LBV69_07180 [Bacteroidales bacterium]|jgi:hypothetical protein|nr:hypothetical protein [Bacteroidales bacterium]
MKKISKLLNLFLVLSMSIIVFSNCEGPEGPTGKDGLNGTDGNANVKYQIFTINTAEWNLNHEENSGYGYYYRYYSVSKPCTGITQDIIDNGLILCYQKYDNIYYQIDMAEKDEPTDNYYVNSGYSVTVGNISFHERIYNANITGQYVYKVVVISATQMASHKNQKVDYKDYNEVKAIFNLSE